MYSVTLTDMTDMTCKIMTKGKETAEDNFTMKVENLVGYEDSDEEEEFAKRDDIQIEQVLPLRQVAPNEIENEEFVPRITWEDFSPHAAEASAFNTSSNSIKWDFVDMGYSSTMVEKAISIHGKENCNEILEYLLACKVADYSLDLVSVDPTVDSERLEGDDESNFGEKKVEGEDTFAEHGDPQEDRSKDLKADNIIAFLLEMGYSEKEVSSAIEINGIDTPIDELVDFIDAHLCGKESNKYAKDAVVANHQVKKQKTQAEESCGSQVAPLEVDEIEIILGFEKDHTRGTSCATDRLHCLEVALHRLGIHLSCVVSVEICEKNRLVLNSWWTKTQQTGSLIQKEDVQDLNTEVLEHLVDTVGGFDLIIGGFTCNNLPGKNSRDDLETKSSIFYEFPRIVNEVREIMHSKASANNFS
ncbi:hypothetical protein SUGI_0082460 [Cryptomeria japonica]|nr:hypothetical protein SUGI_0082460 [Cryptomeria japonica]